MSAKPQRRLWWASRVLSLLAVVFATLLSTGTTSVSAATFTYDAPTITRGDVNVFVAAAALTDQVSGAREQSALPSAEPQGASTTPVLASVATNTGGGGADPPPDNSDMSIDDVLDAASAFLGAGYSEVPPGSGRFVSADGTRVVRVNDSDITGRHGRGPHANFETLECDPQTGRMRVVDNRHVYFKD